MIPLSAEDFSFKQTLLLSFSTDYSKRGSQSPGMFSMHSAEDIVCTAPASGHTATPFRFSLQLGLKLKRLAGTVELLLLSAYRTDTGHELQP